MQSACGRQAMLQVTARQQEAKTRTDSHSWRHAGHRPMRFMLILLLSLFVAAYTRVTSSQCIGAKRRQAHGGGAQQPSLQVGSAPAKAAGHSTLRPRCVTQLDSQLVCLLPRSILACGEVFAYVKHWHILIYQALKSVPGQPDGFSSCRPHCRSSSSPYSYRQSKCNEPATRYHCFSNFNYQKI